MRTERGTIVGAVLLVAAVAGEGCRAGGGGGGGVEEAGPGAISVRFDDMKEGERPPGFSTARTGDGPDGRWVVMSVPSGGRVLAQTSDDDTDYRFPVCVHDAFRATDVSVTARFKTVSGVIDQAGGVVARYKDADNYYICRANVLEENVRLYRVEKGKRQQFGHARQVVTPGEWHTLGLEIRGHRLAVTFDGKKVIEAEDSTFAGPGQVGLWTKSDAVTMFDDLSARDLAPGRP